MEMAIDRTGVEDYADAGRNDGSHFM